MNLCIASGASGEMSLQSIVRVWIFVACVTFSHSIMFRDSIGIDVNDILNEKLMPMSLIYLESNGRNPYEPSGGESNTFGNSTNNMRPTSIGDFGSALNLMNFHRYYWSLTLKKIL